MTKTSSGAAANAQPSPVGAIRVTDVSKSYPASRGRLYVLDGLSLSIKAGEFASIVGPSGAGKSTLFNIIAGLDVPDRGRIFIDDVDTTGTSTRIALMPQSGVLLPWRKVLANATLGLEMSKVPKRTAIDTVTPLLEEFGLDGFEHAWPSELSGGMRQRVALLRTVAMGRPVMLLDEPFAALDALTRTSLQQWLTGVWQHHGGTVVLITHDIREAVFLSDRVFVLGGRAGDPFPEFTVDLPRPRTPNTSLDARATELEVSITDALHAAHVHKKTRP